MALKDRLPSKRVKQLTAKFTSSPVLPMLGWTKVVESFVASGPIGKWVMYATLVTLAWVYADHVQRRMDAAVDAAEDAVDRGDGGD